MSKLSAILQVDNPALDRAIGLYRDIASDHMRALSSTGVAFAPCDEVRAGRRELLEQLRRVGARVRNGGASVALGPLSRGCVACTGPCTSRSYALTNNCHRDCWFCFNPNQEKFAYYCEHPFPWRRQLDLLAQEDAHPACVALTGGEPLLMPDEACAFFARASELFPDAHLRLYTSGDLLDEALLVRLREAGLDEVRFSAKQDDPPHLVEKVFANMALAKRVVPTVMVEMPVIPGTEKQMQGLLQRFEEVGIDGVNLLEFTYAMWNWEVYESLGLALKDPPYPVFYDYVYAGSLAVQGSEELCLRLMLWAHDRGLGLAMHYCSLENKHRAQIRNLTEPYARINKCYAFDYDDFFLKTALAFGPDRAPVRSVLKARGCTELLEDDESDATSFHPRWLPVAAKAKGAAGRPVQLCVSYNVVVEGDGAPVFRELKVERVSDAPSVRLDDVTSRDDEAAGTLQSF